MWVDCGDFELCMIGLRGQSMDKLLSLWNYHLEGTEQIKMIKLSCPIRFVYDMPIRRLGKHVVRGIKDFRMMIFRFNPPK